MAKEIKQYFDNDIETTKQMEFEKFKKLFIGDTQKALAKKIGISESHMGFFKKGELVSITMFCKIIKGLGHKWDIYDYEGNHMIDMLKLDKQISNLRNHYTSIFAKDFSGQDKKDLELIIYRKMNPLELIQGLKIYECFKDIIPELKNKINHALQIKKITLGQIIKYSNTSIESFMKICNFDFGQIKVLTRVFDTLDLKISIQNIQGKEVLNLCDILKDDTLFGNLIKEQRLEKGYSQMDIFRATNIPNYDLNKYEKTRHFPSFERMSVLLNELGFHIYLKDKIESNVDAENKYSINLSKLFINNENCFKINENENIGVDVSEILGATRILKVQREKYSSNQNKMADKMYNASKNVGCHDIEQGNIGRLDKFNGFMNGIGLKSYINDVEGHILVDVFKVVDYFKEIKKKSTIKNTPKIKKISDKSNIMHTEVEQRER